MLSKINKIAVIGTGVIGTGWIIRMLAHNKKVSAFDLNFKQKVILIKEIKRSLPFVKKLYKKKLINLKNLSFKTSLLETLKDVDFIQECASESYKLKTKLMSEIGKYSKPIQTQFGYHLIHLDDRRETPPPSFEDVRSNLEIELQNVAIDTYLRGRLADANVIMPKTSIDYNKLLTLDLKVK